ncbi:hypothetical protein BV898_07523 [Hypsibius exemplaris]|uniref:Uncharacterized protein n=1 Tax=Hypsibius exemplaris TaxID=2072580 RepID=A0A1W0WSY5_HYPEX|nr:hypothetical protein BV898_07523 [Hypsibius exemplaris]
MQGPSFTVLLSVVLVLQVDGKCSRLPSGSCWVNCMQNIFDILCNGVTAEMVRSDISVFAGTNQLLRLYIWNSRNITRLSQDIFSSVAGQILTIDLQDLTALDTFPEVYNVINLRRLSIWNSPNLTALSLELLPRSIYRMSLNKIGLTHFTNDFTETPSLPNLQEFVLRNITIKGWQMDFLKVFPQLTLLEISNSTFDIEVKEPKTCGSGLTEVPTTLRTISSLKLCRNNFVEVTKDNSARFFAALIASLRVLPGATVDISMNNVTISDRSSEWIGGLSLTNQLNMRGNWIVNQLQRGEGAMLVSFDKMEELDLGQTNLRAVQGMFSGLPALRSLILDHNNLANLSHVDIFEGIQSTNLSFLDLSYNDIRFISPDNTFVKIAPQVKHLNLQGNRLQLFLDSSSSIVQNQPTFISAFSNLETLILSNNNFSAFHGFHLASLTKLRVLDISCNPIEFLRKEAFTGLPQSLVDVDVSMCIVPPTPSPWIDWDAFETLPPVKILRLQSGSYKKWIFATMKFSPETAMSLEELYVDNNAISFLQTNTIPRMPNLRVLSMSKNFLQSVAPSVFGNVPGLRKLNLAENRIGILGRDAFSGSKHQLQLLEHLDVSANGLNDTQSGTFDDLPNLKSLMLGWNPMEVEGIFENSSDTLEYLGIQGYSHSCFKPEFFQRLTALHWILPDIYNVVLVNPDERLNSADTHLESLLQVCEFGPDTPDHSAYPNIPRLINYVSVTMHDTDEGDGVQYPMMAAFLPLNYCPPDDYVEKLKYIICTKPPAMPQ